MSLLQTTEETLRLTKEALSDNSLAKTVTVSTGLSAYDLQAPAKNLYPIVTPLRNSLPRVGRLNPGDAARWRTITSITGSGYDAMGWVPEGQRTASMSYSAQLQVAPYLTLGEEDTVTFEAEAAAQGYEDLNATATLRLLQKTMRKEETALLGGNTSLALGTPAAPTLERLGHGRDAAGRDLFGHRRRAELRGLSQLEPRLRRRHHQDHHRQRRQHLYAERRLLDAQRQRHPGGHARPDAERDRRDRHRRRRLRLVCRRGRLRDLAGDHHDQQRDFRRAAHRGTAGLRPSIAADNSRNPTLAFDGLLTVGFNPVNGAYVQTLASGTAGTGTFLTASGRGSVIEIDNMLVADVEQLSAVADGALRQRAGADATSPTSA